MKPRIRLILFICLSIHSFNGSAQCTNIQHLTLDTTVTGFGASGDTPFEFTFPQFDGTLGTLTEVQLSSQVSLSFHYDIENNLGVAKNHRMRLERYDDITSSLLSTPISSSYIGPWRNNFLGASDGTTGSGPDFLSVSPFYIVNNYTIIDQTLYNTADFIGIADVSFQYSTSMFRTTDPASGATINNDASSDVITFTVDYTYCSSLVMAASITAFSADKKDGFVQLNWLVSNETPHHTYEVQKSYDGLNFTTIQTISSTPGVNETGNYNYNYVPLEGDKEKITFRIKVTENSNDTKYSPLRVVDLGTQPAKAALRLSPNPSKGAFAVMLTNTSPGDWNIELFNIKGQVINRKLARNTLLSRFEMNERLSPGVYFVLVTNMKSKQKLVERLLVD